LDHREKREGNNGEESGERKGHKRFVEKVSSASLSYSRRKKGDYDLGDRHISGEGENTSDSEVT